MGISPFTLWPYEVTAPLGEVEWVLYLRTRSRLQRDVALKLLPDNFASDPDRLADFWRSPGSASLNHPTSRRFTA
jgi:hypothetical protein